ncbi:MAG: DUF2802 domain-containing protein [Woeseiaceae bacterium]|nr:DUF2802 domain-containing protein [Woeseiaceae bacterium]
MIISEIEYLYVLLATNFLVLLGGFLAVLRLRQLCRQQEQFWSSPTGTALADKSDEHARRQVLINLRMEKQLASLQADIKAMSSQRSERTATERALPIDNAVRMARNGASIDDLTRSCGLNLGEAQLMKKMHGKALSNATH